METQAKRKARLEASFGKRPADYPDGEEIDYIRGYFDHRRRPRPLFFTWMKPPGTICRWTMFSAG